MRKNESNLPKQLVARIMEQEKRIEDLQTYIGSLEATVKKLKKNRLSGFSTWELFCLLVLRFLRIK